MAFDYEANLTAVMNVLKDANTTTAEDNGRVYLSSGLTTRIDNANIMQVDLETVGVQTRNLPALYVRIVESDEEYQGIGATGPSGSKKMKIVTYEVFGLYRREGFLSSQSALLIETYRLAENIEGAFQVEFQLSGTALWCNPMRTSFGEAVDVGQGNWVKGIRMELEAKYLFR